MTTYNTGNPPGSQDPRDLFDNSSNLDQFMLSQQRTFPDRLGVERSTLKALEDATPDAIAARDRSEAARDVAVLARDASIAAAGPLYATEAEGRAAVADGETFKVVGSGAVAARLYRRISAETSQLEALFPSAAAVEQLQAIVKETDNAEYAYSLLDAIGRIAFGLLADGDVRTASFHGLTILNDLPNGYAWALVDDGGRIAIGVKLDGTVVIGKAVVTELSGGVNQAIIYRSGGRYSDQINFINNTGQSLGEGSTLPEAITTVQEYDNVGFPARALDPAALVPLTVANTQVGSRGESPMYGTLGHIKELILEENGLTYGVNDYQLAACNNSYGGYSILQLNKGTEPYARAMSQVQAIANIAAEQGKTASYQAVTWTQGEADSLGGALMSVEQYKGHLLQLARDYNIDGKAITGQGQNVRLISYQMCSRNRNIAIAQLEASNESDLIYVATPTYIFNFPQDDVHIDAESSKWLGAYYGLAYKRLIVDGKDWKPLQPVGHAVLGNTIDVIFNKDGLKIDTTMVPAQPDYGFQIVDGAGVAQALSSVTLVGHNRVRLTLASGSPAPGWAVRFGFANAVGKGFYVGGCGNLRDSQGDTIVYAALNKPMHNWCVIFNYPI